METKSAAALYSTLEKVREPYLDRARDAANFTLPQILTPEGSDGSTDLARPYQTVGARGVTSLSSKMLQALFPTSQPNFQLKTDIFALSKIEEEEGGENTVNILKANLARVEQAVMNEFDSKGFRPMIHETLKQLVVAGNVLVNLPKKGNMKVFKMDTYVIKRDHQGSPVLMVIQEHILPMSLPKDIQETIIKSSDDDINALIPIFTMISLEDDEMWHVIQEVGGVPIPSTKGTYEKDKLPYIALRLEPMTGEDWGYGYVTQLLGDLITLEGLTQALAEAAAAASKVIFLVNPAAVGTNAKELAEAPNGSFVEGRAEDVTILTLGSKASDMNIAFQTANGIRASLEAAFLLNSSFQRNQDRVTATEFSIMANELETVLAGTYSLLAIDYQLPLITLVMQRMIAEGRLPELPKDLVLPTITTGLNALGRGSELNRLDSFIGGANQVLGQQAMAYIDLSNYLDRRLTALGLLNDGLLKTKETLKAEAEQQNQKDMVNRFGSEVLRQANEPEQPK